ncbi:MAG: xanthine dehydrogenase [Beijerinckiaceae bacterium]|jgi:hypothetical protein
MTYEHYSGRRGEPRPFGVILGVNEIASAVAVHLHGRGYHVVLSHDPSPPVIRRKMAFHDALFEDAITLEGVQARRVDTGFDVVTAMERRHHEVMITKLGILDLLVVRPLDVLVDARMQKYQTIPDLRQLARVTIGLGPGFAAGENCQFAIETHPAQVGRIIQMGAASQADGLARELGGRGSERFVYSEVPGRWHTPIEIGSRVFKDYIVGYLGERIVRAPFDGTLRGVARDGTEVPAGVKLLEVDPRVRGAVWAGIDERSRHIARAVTSALALHDAIPASIKAKRKPYLVR